MLHIGKVLMVVENRPVPTDVRVWAEAKALRERGFEVSIISPKDSSIGCPGYCYLDGIHLYAYAPPRYTNSCLAYLWEYSLSLAKTWWLSLRVLRRHGFDVIHAANPPDQFFLLHWFYFLLGKRFIFDQHDLAPEVFQAKFGQRFGLLYAALLWLERRSYKAADLVITTNESQRQFALKPDRGQCAPEKVFVVRNCPQLERLQRVPAEQILRRGRPYLLVYLGGMELQDGVDYALRALHELIYVRGRRDISLALLGDGGDVPRLKELVHKLEIEAFVFFTGWVDAQEIGRYLSTADIGLCPDPRNGLNEFCTMVKSMEYMAMGLPIVAFDLAETHATCQQAALYATPNSVSSFASQVARLLDEPELRALMGKYARTLVEGTLNWEREKQNLLRAYATLFPQQSAVKAPLTARKGKVSEEAGIAAYRIGE